MNPEYWKSRWEKGQIGFHGANYHSSLEAFWHKYMPSSHTVFVPFCGKSHDLLWLAHQNYKVVGCEVSEIACEQFFEENNLKFKIREHNSFVTYESENIDLWCGDMFKLKRNQLPTFDAIYDRAALVALPYAMRSKYVQFINKISIGNVSQFLISFEYDSDSEIGPPFSVNEMEIEHLYQEKNIVINITEKEIELLPQAKLYKKGVHTMREKVYLIQSR